MNSATLLGLLFITGATKAANMEFTPEESKLKNGNEEDPRPAVDDMNDYEKYCICRPAGRLYSAKVSINIDFLPRFLKEPTKVTKSSEEPIFLEVLETLFKTLIKTLLTAIMMSLLKKYKNNIKLNGLAHESLSVSIKIISGILALGVSKAMFVLVSASFNRKLHMLMYKLFIQRSVKLTMAMYWKTMVSQLSTEINRLVMAKPIERMIENLMSIEKRVLSARIVVLYEKLKCATIAISLQTRIRKSSQGLAVSSARSSIQKVRNLAIVDITGYFTRQSSLSHRSRRSLKSRMPKSWQWIPDLCNEKLFSTKETVQSVYNRQNLNQKAILPQAQTKTNKNSSKQNY
jgi:hypothetical protein